MFLTDSRGLAAFHVGPCDVGRGVFASRAMAAGQPILRFDGPVLTLADVRTKGPLAANVLQIGYNRYLDLAEPGRLINHSCSPNAGIIHGVELAAICPIECGEQIRFDYSTTIGDFWTMPCLCRSAACRGVVAAFGTLPVELQKRYAALGIVQRFLLPDGGSRVAAVESGRALPSVAL